jgi:tetratricopeptide (TPR) repeat protein
MGESDCFDNIGYVHSKLGKYNEAFEYYNKALKIFKEVGNRTIQAYCLNNIGFVLSVLGDYSSSLEYYKKSLNLSRDVHDLQGEAYSLNNMGKIYIFEGKYNEAEKYLKEGEKIVRKIGSKEILRRIYSSFSELEINKNNKKKAEEYGEKAFNLALELNFKLGEAEAFVLLGRIDRKKAEKKFKEAIKIFEDLGNQFELGKSYYYYGEFLMNKGEIKKATEYIEKAENIFEKISAKGWIKRVEELWEKE